jgi:hypothetical protein
VRGGRSPARSASSAEAWTRIIDVRVRQHGGKRSGEHRQVIGPKPRGRLRGRRRVFSVAGSDKNPVIIDIIMCVISSIKHNFDLLFDVMY